MIKPQPFAADAKKMKPRPFSQIDLKGPSPLTYKVKKCSLQIWFSAISKRIGTDTHKN